VRSEERHRDEVGVKSLRAAQYVRMSTDHQKYSIENQAAAIAAYAAHRNITIVRTYADHGRSGVRIDGREELQRLIKDVRNRQTDFTLILVYDISRIQPSIIEEIIETLLRIKQSNRISIILVEQNLEFISSLSDRVLTIQKGRITGEIAGEALKDNDTMAHYAGAAML
jgi:DNA invertase Pin-like site-specific DNA recombinase